MIIIDDNSTDNSVPIVKEYMKQEPRIKLIELHTQHGPALARNEGISLAQGRYISFLDSDDTWVAEKLKKQLDFMQKHHLAFTYSSYFIMDEKGSETGKFIVPEEISYHSLLKTCSVGCLTAIYDTQKLGKRYMEAKNLRKGEDYVLWLDIFKEIQKTKGLNEPLASYRIQTTSLSSNKFNAAKAQWHVYRHFEKLNIFQSAYYLIHYAFYGFLKYRS
jgi:glycosyltransferase involved in cell wall biosynthesis